MTHLRDWTTDELIDGLRDKWIDVRCQAAYELGRRKDTESLKSLLPPEILPDTKTDWGASHTALQPINLLLHILFKRADEPVRGLILCAAAGFGAEGAEFIYHISKTYQWMNSAYLVRALKLCKPEIIEMFIEYLYECRFSQDLVEVLLYQGALGIQVLLLGLSSGDRKRRENIISGFRHNKDWMLHDHLVYAIIQCIYDDDLRIARDAINLIRQAKLATATPYLIPLLRNRNLVHGVQDALCTIGTPEALKAVNS